ncbi:transmembrane signal receptor [Lithospermum erythrorhizon]|uniref:Transmembrane signal receptor n=1 Tax=Lithospermum erythrorhizon TaxID=34254 RepID=A0AAV3NQ73_LITER
MDDDLLLYHIVKYVPEAPHNSVTPCVSLPHTGAPSIPDVPVDLPVRKRDVGCKWVFAVKTNPDGSIALLKARLVAKGYAQTYGVDYLDTFAHVAKLTYVKLFIYLAATYDWQLYQLDIKDVFLYGDLEEEVYMEQPPGFVAQGEYGK